MPRMIFVNLPVSDLERSTRFYEAVGAVKDKTFCDDKAANCMVFSDTINAMLITHQRFADFTPKRIPDAHEVAQVLLCLTADSREDVDAWLERASGAGARVDPTPAQDLGFMYGRSFEDPDGHTWEVVWMDVEAAKAAMQPQAEAAGA